MIKEKLIDATSGMQKGVPCIVLPTNRDGFVFQEFYKAWEKQFEGCNVIIIEDRPTPILFTGSIGGEGFSLKPKNVIQFGWEDIDSIMGEDAWIIPRKSDCVRSFGFLVAAVLEPLFILTLDDDTFPVGNTIVEHYNVLNKVFSQDVRNYNTLRGDRIPRGIVESWSTPQMVHGAWVNVPDYSAEQHAKNFGETITIDDFNQGLIPAKAYAPICGMNLSFTVNILQQVYFGLQGSLVTGEKLIIDRCGDIWMGYFVQACESTVATGYAPVEHRKLSNVWANMVKEKEAAEMTSLFLDFIDGDFDLEPVYQFDTIWLPQDYKDYFKLLHKAYVVWDRIASEILGNKKMDVSKKIERIKMLGGE
jgi:hypothetical protein